MRKISIYGKGGVGKSIIASHIAAVMQQRGDQVALVGCSPKADSTYLLLGQHCRPTILEQVQARKTQRSDFLACVHKDSRNIVCLETGGPEPASGCAGRGVAHALQMSNRMRLLEQEGVTFTIYDVIADVVCGGFTEPIRRGYASEIYIVTSGELMSMYAANNICNAALLMQQQGVDVHIGGLIHNARGIENEDELVERFAERIGLPVLSHIPRSPLIQEGERQKRLVTELYPGTEISRKFYELADNLQNSSVVQPHPIESRESISLLSKMVLQFDGSEIQSESDRITSSYVFPVAKAGSDQTNRQNQRVAIYGKAGIGKSTIASNISAALAKMSEKVLQIGCDPKHDSVALLTGGMVPTVLDMIHAAETAARDKVQLEQVIFPGFGGVFCVESGGPKAGVGCAGQGVFVALEYLEKEDVFSKYDITFSLFDVLGDVVCGGFAQPLRGGFCQRVYVVTNGEPLSLLVTNNILKAVARMQHDGISVGVAGIINNQRGVEYEKEIVEAYAARVGVPVIAHIPRSPIVQKAEAQGKTVMEYAPDSHQAEVYRGLARFIRSDERLFVPSPLKDMEDILNIVQSTVPNQNN